MSSHSNHRPALPPSTSLYTVIFARESIETTVTSDPESAKDWVDRVRRRFSVPMLVGLDCEWKPNRIAGAQPNKVAILQLCIENHCLVLQLFHMSAVPPCIAGFLRDPNVNFVGVGVDQDIAKLEIDYGLYCCNSTDLEEHCKAHLGSNHWAFWGRPRLGLKGYAWHILGFRMEKPRHVTLSNWDARVLSEEQIQYACIDAYVSFSLASKLIGGR